MKKLVLFGAGSVGIQWAEKLGKKEIWKIVDSDPVKWGKTINGIEIVSVDEMKKCRENIIIYISSSKNYISEIRSILVKNGIGNAIVNSPYAESIVRAERGAIFDSKTVFRGDNYIGNNSEVYESDLGYKSYISYNSVIMRAKIGKFSAIGDNVRLIIGRHPTDFVSIHPAFYSIDNIVSVNNYIDHTKYKEFKYTINNYSIEIGNDVWIGAGAKLMEGICIGDGAVVAAGAIVTKDVSPYEIVGGIPAKRIRMRFSNEDVKFLSELKWWDKDDEWLRKFGNCFSDIKALRNMLNRA